MKNITVSVPDEVYRNARVAAAQRDTSVSALVVAFLEQLSGRMDEFARLEALQHEVQAGIRQFRAADRRAATRSTTVRFVDTNVLLYAISRDPAEQDKAKRANDILAERDLALSVQVLQEFYVQATRASRPDAIAHRQAVRLIESFRRFPVQDLTSAIMMAARTPASVPALVLGRRDHRGIRAMGCTEDPDRAPGRRPGLRRNPGHQSVPLRRAGNLLRSLH